MTLAVKQTAELVAVKREITQITTDLETLARTGHLQTKVTR
jgi:hypothetical protein